MYTHKPTTPGDSRSKTERTVYCDGKTSAKSIRLPMDHQRANGGGRWSGLQTTIVVLLIRKKKHLGLLRQGIRTQREDSHDQVLGISTKGCGFHLFRGNGTTLNKPYGEKETSWGISSNSNQH